MFLQTSQEEENHSVSYILVQNIWTNLKFQV